MFIIPPEDDPGPEQWTKAEIGIAVVVALIIVFILAQMIRSWA